MPRHTQDVNAEDDNTDDSPADPIGQPLAAHCPDVHTDGPAQDVSPRSAAFTGVTQSQTCHATSRGFDADPAYPPESYTDCQTWLLDHRHSDTFIPARQMVDPQTHAAHCARIYDIVRATGVPNFIGAKVPLLHGFNISRWRHYLVDYTDDPVLCDMLDYGWPVNYTAPWFPSTCYNNHQSAIAFPDCVRNYIISEQDKGTLVGPFPFPPFSPLFQTSPLMSRPKKHSANRRIIVDFSWPPGQSVNSGIPKDTYLGAPYKLRLPTVDDLVSLILKHGSGCYLWSTDLARAYCQLRSCPLDWPLLGITWNGQYYMDTSIGFGLRWGAMCCTRMTSGIRYIMSEHGYDSLNFIDDFAGAAQTLTSAHSAFTFMHGLLSDLGVEENTEKASPPATSMVWIGVEFDTLAMEIRMPADKIADTSDILHEWSHKASATKSQIRSILGKLFHIGQTCKPARLFISRMLETLRAAPEVGLVQLNDCFKRDINWFLTFLPRYNGIHIIQSSRDTQHIEVDSCLTGCGGLYREGRTYFHTMFPPCVLLRNHCINHLEMLTVVVAMKLWSKFWANKRVMVSCDNAAAVSVLTHGRSTDAYLLSCAREIWLLTAQHDIELAVQHKAGYTNTDADALSRQHLSTTFDVTIQDINGQGFTRDHVDPHQFNLTNDL